MKNIRLYTFCLVAIICSLNLNAQYNLNTKDTTFQYRLSSIPERRTRSFQSDTMRIGTNAYQNSFIIYGDSDSVVVSHDKSRKLEDQHTYITIVSPTKKIVLRTSFWAMNHEFSEEYVKKQMGRI